MKNFKIILLSILVVALYTSLSFAWTENVALTGLDGQTINAQSSAYADIDMATNGYHLIVVHIKLTFDNDATNATTTTHVSVDSGSNVSDYSVSTFDQDSTGIKDCIIKISQYPYVRIKVTNDSEETGADDDVVVWAKYAIY